MTSAIGIEDDFNLYAYTRNDPLNRADPTGQAGELIAAGCAITVEVGCAPGAAVGAVVEGVIYVGAAIYVGYKAGKLLSESKNAPADKPADDKGKSQPSRSNPLVGEPGTAKETQARDGQPKQTREYGADGYPDRDIDHDHGQGQPHVHDWTRPSDGSPPTHGDRQPGRAPQEGEIDKVRGKCVDPTKGC